MKQDKRMSHQAESEAPVVAHGVRSASSAATNAVRSAASNAMKKLYGRRRRGFAPRADGANDPAPDPGTKG